ncbi:MAG: hypothetical protein A2498_16350 [Lentisphaerae bacterium RIFOXYC12_FULL_60_16]|nr:MAG: hypothetical protein A2498_16350 [Lentisphaerae bacterium RIFOXYC12_FULL_60_16]
MATRSGPKRPSEIPYETHVRVEEHPDAGGGSIDGSSDMAGAAGIERLTVMRSLEKPGYAGHHRIRDAWTVVLTLGGAGAVSCGEESWRTEADSVYCVPPGALFNERNAGPGEWHYICLQVTLRRHATWLALKPNRPFYRGPLPQIAALMRHIVQILHRRQQGCELTAVGLCLAVFGELQGKPSEWEGIRHPVARRAKQLIDLDPARVPGNPELAKRCHTSTSTLAHTFKSETGYSVHAYVMSCRVLTAKGLLLSGCSVSEVATRLGFSNPFHFSRIFRQHEGVSPRQFKQMGGKQLPA